MNQVEAEIISKIFANSMALHLANLYRHGDSADGIRKHFMELCDRLIEIHAKEPRHE